MVRPRALGLPLVLLLVLSFSLSLSLWAAPAVAQEGDGGGETEGGLEGLIGGFVESQGIGGVILVLAGGGLLLTVCVEKLIDYLTRAALWLRVSAFALALVFTGIEFDDTVLALVFSAGDLEGAALGTALGTALAIVGVTFALAAIVRPFAVDLPTDYVVVFGAAPVVLVPFVLAGTLTFVHGLLLVGTFLLAFGYLAVREFRRDQPLFRDSGVDAEIHADGGVALPSSVSEIPEDRFVGGRPAAGWLWLGLAALALVGIVLASMLLEAGSEAVIEGFGIEETVFGATVLTAILTFEDVMLTVEPVRRGVPEIGVGNVIGSVLFSVTANVGVIMLVSDLAISGGVVTLHLPAVILVTALAAFFLSRGRLERRHGALLGGLYVAYWIVALVVFGGVPLGG